MSSKSSPFTVHFSHSAYNLAERFEVRNTGVPYFQTWNPGDLLARIDEAEVLVLSGYWKNDLLAKAKKLKYVQACSVGYDHFDQAALKAAGVRLSNSAGANANAVSEHAIALMLGLTRQLHTGRDNQQAKQWRGMIADLTKREEELPGKTMLIYGLGTIGQRIARVARALDMKVIGVKRDLSVGIDVVDELHPPAAFVGLLPRADFVVLCCPLTEQTRDLMNQDAFAAMHSGSYLINVARGGCVDQDALCNALTNKKIAGAGIDVTTPEPLDATSPLWGFKNVILTPHTGGETRQYEDNVIDILVENLKRLAAGDEPLNAIV